jgi:hypothetical protein
MRTITPLLALAIASSCLLHAQEQREANHKVVSITLSPASALGSMAEVIAEVRIDRYNSIAVMGGAGSNYYTPLLYTIGAQYNWYALGDFQHGLQIGCEVLYSHLGFDPQYLWHPAGNALGAGPYVGYKVILGGFTANLQAGPQLAYGKYVYPRALYSGLTGDRPTYGMGLSMTLNATIGWSF